MLYCYWGCWPLLTALALLPPIRCSFDLVVDLTLQSTSRALGSC